MRILADQDNINPPDADYPNGWTRDKAGAVPGTLTKDGVFGDIIQFFQKLLIATSVTANGNPDNVTNGYQLEAAIIAHRKLQTVVVKANTSDVVVHHMSILTDILKVTFTILALQKVLLPSPTIAASLNRVITLYCDTAIDSIGGEVIEITNPSSVEMQTTEDLTGIHAISLRSNGSKWMILSKTDSE